MQIFLKNNVFWFPSLLNKTGRLSGFLLKKYGFNNFAGQLFVRKRIVSSCSHVYIKNVLNCKLPWGANAFPPKRRTEGIAVPDYKGCHGAQKPGHPG